MTLPSGFLWEFGQTVSRTTYANLLSALRISFTASFSNGSPTLSSVSTDLRNLGLEGAVLECATPGITNLTISSIASGSITMSGNATAGSSGSVTIFAYPYGNGNGSTTFTIPDRRGTVLAGRDNMSTTPGTAAAGRLTDDVPGGILGTKLGSGGTNISGEQSHQIQSFELASHSHGVNDPGHSHGVTRLVTASTGTAGGGNLLESSSSANTNAATTGISIQSNGSDVNHNNVQPTGISNYIIKI